MTQKLHTLLSRLEKVKSLGNGKYKACCPVPDHDDKVPSLGVTLFDNDKIGINCWSGCSVVEIVTAVGLELSDLMPESVDYKKGANVLHLDGVPAGYCEDFKQHIKAKWRSNGSYPKLTDQQRIDFRIEKHRQERLRNAEEKQRHNGAAQKAAYIMKQSKPVTQRPYLTKKRIEPHNARLYNDTLVIPILNKGELVSLQFINNDGDKHFLAGGKIKGSYATLGQYQANKPILLCEGWATGASLYEHTESLTYIAFSANNLKEVAIYVRSLYAKSDIIIMGDNDRSGVGQRVAREAALAINASYMIPDIDGYDWNDVVNMEVLA